MLASKTLILYLSFAIYTSLYTSAMGQSRLSLQKAIDLTLSRNLQIKLAMVDERTGSADLAQAGYNRLPSFGMSSQLTRNWGRTLDVPTYSYVAERLSLANISANTQLTLFQGGQLRNQVLENKILLDVGKGMVDKIKNDLILNVVTTYLQILADQDVVTAAKAQMNIAKE